MGKFKRLFVFALVGALLLMNSFVCAFAVKGIVFVEQIISSKQKVTYSVEVSPDSEICGLSLNISYDEKQLKLDNCSLGDVLDVGISKANTNINGKVILTFISTEPLVNAGNVIKLDFSPLSSISKANIFLQVSECIDINCNDLDFVYQKDENINFDYTQQISSDPNTPEDAVTSNTESSVQSLVSDNKTSSASSDYTDTLGSNTATESSDVTQTESVPPKNDDTGSLVVDTNENENDKFPILKWGIIVAIIVLAIAAMLILYNHHSRRKNNENTK